MHIDSLYETDLNLTLRLQTLQPPANNHHPSSSSSPPHSPVRELGGQGSGDSCNSPRAGYNQPADDTPGSATMAQNEYTMEPSNLPHNVTISRDSALNVNRGSMIHHVPAPATLF